MQGYGTKYDNIIKRNYLKISTKEMARRYLPEAYFFQRRIKKLGLKVPKHLIKKWKYTRRNQDTTHDKYIKKNYLIFPVKTLAKKINKSHTFVQDRLKKLGLKIPRKIIEQRIHQSRFQKGIVPATKGMKWDEYMSKQGQENSRKSQFKKGEIPPNKRHYRDRMITLHTDSKTQRKYWWIRISMREWKMYHVEIWERENGPVPPGYIIVFKDKNSLHCVIENLESITLAENMRRNTLHNLPEELKSTIHLIAGLSRKINRYEKQDRRSA